MFFLSIGPALLTVYILFTVEESKAWKAAASQKKDWKDYFGTIAANGKRLLYLALLMSGMARWRPNWALPPSGC